MRRIAAIPALCLVAALTACTSGSRAPEPSAAICGVAPWLDGHLVTAADWSAGCQRDGRRLVAFTYRCPDGRRLRLNDFGWGYEDDAVHVPAGRAGNDPSFAAARHECP